MEPIDQERASRRGATAIEYGLLAALVAVGIIVALSAMSNGLSTQFNSLSKIVGDQRADVQGGGGGGNSGWN